MIKIKKIKLVKLSDNVFNGRHPNGINTGWSRTGMMLEKPIVGRPFFLNDFRTSTVVEIVDKNTFKTLNSTYQIIRL